MAIGDKAAAKGYIVPPDTQAHSLGAQNDRQALDYLADEVDARAYADSLKQNALGYVPVRQTSATIIGIRDNPASSTGTGYPRLVVLIGGTEYEVPILLDVAGAEARLNARMSRNGIGA